MKKLLLIHPAVRSHYTGFGDTDAWGIPPLSLAYVAALTPEDWDIKIVDEYVEPINFEEPADLVGMTSYSCNITRAYEVAAEFKKRNIPVVLGGVHASAKPEEALQYVDSIVIGEAESNWPQVIADFLAGKLQKKYTGAPGDLKNLVIPRRDLFPGRYAMTTIQTSRGCPFDCEYCSIKVIYGKAYRMRPVEEILDELEGIKEKIIYFIDDNFFGSGQVQAEKVLELCKGMIKRKIKKIWATQASINVAKHPEVLKYMYKSGCRAIYIGLESIIMENLKQYNKPVNYTLEAEGIRQAIKTIHKYKIGATGAFILGGDHDDMSVFQKTLEYFDYWALDVVQIGVLTPFPGTKTEERLLREDRIFYKNYPDDWEQYDTDHLTYKPKLLTPIDLIRGFDYVARKKFTRGRVFLDALKTLFRTRSITSTILAYSLNSDSIAFYNFNKKYKKAGKKG